jgi:hypothetical protein
MFNQLYPYSDLPLANQAKHKDLLGYHDIRVGNAPDERLKLFISTNLPSLLPRARSLFDQTKDLLAAYGNNGVDYDSFRDQVKARLGH